MEILPVPTWEYHLLLPHPTEPRLLLLPNANGWVLPHWRTQTPNFWQTVSHINAGMTGYFGLAVTTLRLLRDFTYPENRLYINLYELENSASVWIPPIGARWVGQTELAELPLVYPEQRATLEEWFAEFDQTVPIQRPAWAQRGWFGTTHTWIMAQLGAADLSAIGSVEQLRTWERSCVLRVNTDNGYFYFKAVPAWFAHEFRLVELLKPEFPANYPQLVAYDHARNWVLMRDFGGLSLDAVPDVTRWEEALRRLAQIQHYTVKQQAELANIGCPVRPIESLVMQIEPFFSQLETYTHNRWSSLSREDITQLQELAPRLKENCAKLAAYNLPIALEHGDLWPGNVIVTANDYLFFDWSDSSLSHPFFSLWSFLDADSFIDEGVKAAFASVPNLHNRLRDAYLSEWLDYASMEQLIEAFELAQLLAPLHAALTYHLYILLNMEARWQMESMVTFYLKRLLELSVDSHQFSVKTEIEKIY